MESGSSIPSLKLDLDFVELHAPLFLGGKNHQMKLTATRELRLVYDREHKEVLVYWQGPKGPVEGIVPIGTVLSMVPKKAEDPIPIDKTAAVRVQKGEHFTAQVSTPQDHVFKGIGNGKTNSK